MRAFSLSSSAGTGTGTGTGTGKGLFRRRLLRLRSLIGEFIGEFGWGPATGRQQQCQQRQQIQRRSTLRLAQAPGHTLPLFRIDRRQIAAGLGQQFSHLFPHCI